ncbi:MAG: cation transporter [Bacteroidaceae bacterium]|nr:cation transporter [Bacteroidaceae bacterium]
MTHHHNEGAGHNILAAFFINLAFTAIALIGGWLTNSMAIISDSIHDLGCTLSIGLAWGFEHIAKHRPTHRFTFGYRRFALLGAFVNACILLSGATVVLHESIERLSSPVTVDAHGMMWFALLAIAFKGVAAWRTWRGSSVNQRMVSLHLLGDCLGWVAVLVASLVMMVVEIPLLDPLLSIGISLYLLYNVVRNLITAFRIVLEGVPATIDYHKVEAEVAALDGVAEVQQLHIWSMDNEHHMAEVILATPLTDITKIEQLKGTLRTILHSHSVEQCVIEVTPITHNPLSN